MAVVWSVDTSQQARRPLTRASERLISEPPVELAWVSASV